MSDGMEEQRDGRTEGEAEDTFAHCMAYCAAQGKGGRQLRLDRTGKEGPRPEGRAKESAADGSGMGSGGRSFRRFGHAMDGRALHCAETLLLLRLGILQYISNFIRIRDLSKK